ncbi:PAS domain S-box protein [Hymenobacter chitinivorans]|uniref:histidine kinase n=1 Tax=Hymenobacter chitinivorans DSM 11115 TaxID=1121954 RepID=A0A2M9BNS7_9BACT|nr:PAS domain S-box protein [Hymenobacter chitinivorans]PJJ59592.1 PAS domain S-box-containing protein [Hymenobacter chitinivorans DSM 11115]
MNEHYSINSTNPWEKDVQLVQQVFDAVAVLDPQGHILWGNDGLTSLVGQPPAELRQRTVWAVLGGSGAGQVTATYVQAQLRAEAAFRYEALLQHSNTSAQWVRVRVQPLPASAAPGRFVALVELLTDSSATQQALAENEVRFRYLTEHVPGVLFQWRHNHTTPSGLVYISPRLRELFGIVLDNDKQLEEFIHPDDRPRWKAALQQAGKEDGSWAFEGRLLVPGQPLRWFRGTAIRSLSDAEGSLHSGILVDVTALKQAEEALRANEQRWQLAMERFGDGAWEFNYQTGEEYFSAAYQAMLGYEEAEFAREHQSWLTHVHPDDVAVSLQASDAYLSGREPIYSVERRLRCRNGEYKWVLTRGLVTKSDAEGKPLIMTGVHTDISAIKAANAAVEASRLRLSTTIANFQEGILLVDEDHRVMLANEAICRLFNSTITGPELVGLDARQFGEQAKNRLRDEQEFVARYQRLIQQQQLATGETFVLKDGRVLQGDFVPIHIDAQYIGYLWKFQDITERQISEDKLRRREEKYRSIIEYMKLGLVETSMDGVITYVNQAFCDITGYDFDEFLHQQAMQRVVSPDNLQLLTQKNADRAQGISDTYELTITSKSGQRKWLLISAAPVYNDAREVYGSIGITLDITDRKELEHNLRRAKEAAEESARSKELFLANMSHEIRTPMNAILGMGQLLAKTPLDAEQQNYLRAIATSGENLLVIINDILDLSKIGASQLFIERIGFSLTALLQQIEKSLHFKAEEKSLRFLIQADTGLPPVLLGDPYRITQVLLNLAGNSIKFTEKGQVSIICELVGHTPEHVELRFTVADTGIGIDADFLGNIFQEFSQEDSSVTRKFGGTGLGLSISRSLVNLMGGEIDIVSRKNEGTRSSFTLRLAIGSEKDMPQKAPITADIRERLRGKRVLLTEDNAFNRQIAKGFLQNAALLVTEAENGAVAVELARQQSFDLILMDVQMPVMNGLEATAQLREELGLTTPIIALTANAIKGEREKCLRAGMNDYLSKPFQEDDLLKVISYWTLGEPLVGNTAQEPGAPALTAPLYNLALIYQIGQGDPDFTVLMLESFIEGAEEAVRDLRQAQQTQNVELLRATTHKLKPSLEHLQVHLLLPVVQQLDTWRGAFDQAQLTPLIDRTSHVLQRLIAHLNVELQDARPGVEPS